MKAVPKYLARVVGSSAPPAGNALRPPHFLFGPVGLPLADGERALPDAVGRDNSSLNAPNLDRPNLNGPGPSLEPRATWSQKAREMASENPIASTPLELGPPSFNQAEAPAPWPLSGSARRPVDRPEADAESLVDYLPGGTHRHTRALLRPPLRRRLSGRVRRSRLEVPEWWPRTYPRQLSVMAISHRQRRVTARSPLRR